MGAAILKETAIFISPQAAAVKNFKLDYKID